MSSPTNTDGSYDPHDGRGKRYVEGPVQLMEGMRPGVVSISWHFGHWAYGSQDVEVDGKTWAGDPSRARGIAPNPVMLVDSTIANVCLTDPIGGSASFFDTPVKLTPIET